MKHLLLIILSIFFCMSVSSCRKQAVSAESINDKVTVAISDSSSDATVICDTTVAIPKNVEKWYSCAEIMAGWYRMNFDNYSKYLNGMPCKLINGKVRDDCSGLTTACLQYYGLYKGRKIFCSADFRSANGELGTLLKTKFTPIKGEFKQTDYSKFQPGDILAGYIFENGKVNKEHGHVTIYAGNGKFFDWGGWAYKSKTQPVAGEESAGFMHDHVYTIIWRMK